MLDNGLSFTSKFSDLVQLQNKQEILTGLWALKKNITNCDKPGQAYGSGMAGFGKAAYRIEFQREGDGKTIYFNRYGRTGHETA